MMIKGLTASGHHDEMDKLLPDPFSASGEAERWFRDHQLLLPIPLLYSHKPAEFSVRVLTSCLNPMCITPEDAALMQLLYAARQRLTARLSKVQTMAWPELMTPADRAYDVDCTGALWTELSLLHAQVRLLTASYPQLGLYNEAWRLFCDDMGRYAPWLARINDSGEWCALVHRQQGILVKYEEHASAYDDAKAKWPRRK